MRSDSDKLSTWTYDGEGPPDTFDLAGLHTVVAEHFGRECTLVKIAQGGFHKVYDVTERVRDGQAGKSLNAVVRVASPAFPRDKLRSEVATLRYIASYTSVPVPFVYAWNADASNPAGAEYIIMQKIPGVTAHQNWETLPVEIKEKVVVQVAEHLASLFALRFELAGSLYFSSDELSGTSRPPSPSLPSSQQYRVGPIVSSPFYRALNGRVDHPTTDLHTPSSPFFSALHALRGPFTHIGDFLVHPLRALLYKCTTFPEETVSALDTEELEDAEEGEKDPESVHAANEEVLQTARRVLPRAIELCYVYPGNASVYPPGTAIPSRLDHPFTLYLDDFRLVNILIDENTGKVNALIDFEGAVTAPLWRAASVPYWIPDPAGDTASWYGGTPDEQRRLWDAFHATMERCAPEWRAAYEGGRGFRELAERTEMGVQVWGDTSGQIGRWVEERLGWAREEGHAGVAMPEREDDEV